MPLYLRSTDYSGGTNLNSTLTYSQLDENFIYLDTRINEVSSSLGNRNIGVFYVNKNYSGTGSAIVAGYTTSSISSVNTSYIAQLNSASMGFPNRAYPDPWAARNAAMEAMASGSITRAYIQVLGGSQYTVGSDVSTNNGPATGGATTATIADVGFSSANRTAVASLMKHNIFYHFEDNSGLFHINRTYAINSGCHNVDSSHITFVSGIFGNGIFHQVYGEGDGTISAFSQRFIEINNTRCSIDFECYESALQRASLYLFSHKKLHVRIKNFYTPSESFGIAMQGVTDPNEGDGLPTSIVFDVENAFKGDEFYPYSLITSGVTLSRPLFAIDVISSVRQKNISLSIKNLYVSSVDLSNIYAPFLGGINRNCTNHNLKLELDNLYHKTDTARQALLVTSAALIDISGGASSNWIRENFHETFIIHNADINASLIELRAIHHGNVANKNNSITVKLGTVVRRGSNSVSRDYIIGLPVPTGAGSVANSIIGEKPIVNISADRVVAQTGKIFNNVYSGVPIYIGATTIAGTYITKDGSSVVNLIGSGSAFVLKDASLVAKGAATNAITVSNSGNPVNIFSQQSYSNLISQVGITEQGTLNIDANIANYL
jgi:hypothetical protein